MWPTLQQNVDMVRLTGKILNVKLDFLCSEEFLLAFVCLFVEDHVHSIVNYYFINRLVNLNFEQVFLNICSALLNIFHRMNFRSMPFLLMSITCFIASNIIRSFATVTLIEFFKCFQEVMLYKLN